MHEFLIHSKRCFVGDDFVEATLHIKNEVIHKIYNGANKFLGIPYLEYGNYIIMPGIIDAHVHINEPGRTHWEGFNSATKAAALGGITTIIEMPLNASPVTTNVEALNLKEKASNDKLHVNCGFYGGVVPSNLDDIEDLIKEGVFGIKGFLTHSGIDEFPNVTKEHLYRIAPVLKQYNIPLLLHCELSDDSVPSIADTKSYREYVNSRPLHWETKAIELALDIQRKFDIKVHIVHLSAAEGIAPIVKQKQSTNKLTVETCPHYLFFNAETIPDAAPIYKCAPPIREKKNNDKLWNAVQDGTIDFIASDHSPAPPEMKHLESGNLMKAWGGIAGLQLTFPVLYTKGMENNLPLNRLIPMLTRNPAKFLGLENCKGTLKKGFDADLTVLDDTQRFVVTESMIGHRHKLTPYLNTELHGRVVHSFVNGVQVVENSKVVNLQKGKLLKKGITARKTSSDITEAN